MKRFLALMAGVFGILAMVMTFGMGAAGGHPPGWILRRAVGMMFALAVFGGLAGAVGWMFIRDVLRKRKPVTAPGEAAAAPGGSAGPAPAAGAATAAAPAARPG